MAGKSITQLYAAGEPSLPEAMANPMQQYVAQRLANKIVVEYSCTAEQRSFLTEFVGPQLHFSDDKTTSDGFRVSTRVLAQRHAYMACGLEPEGSSSKRWLIVGPHEGEVLRFGSRTNVDFLPFFHSFEPANHFWAIAKALNKKRSLPARNPKDWLSYKMVSAPYLVDGKVVSQPTMFRSEPDRPYAYVANFDVFKHYCDAVAQDLAWKSKCYDVVLVTEHAAPYMSKECWSNLEYITGASELWWYSPFVPEIVFGPLVPSDVYSYKEFDKDTGVNVFDPDRNPVDALTTAKYPIHCRTLDDSLLKKAIPECLHSLFTGSRKDAIGVVSWKGMAGSRPGSQVTAPLGAWALLSGLNPIVVQLDFSEFTPKSHLIPRIEMDFGTYNVGVWRAVRQPFTCTFNYVLPKSRWTVRVPRVSRLTAAWHPYRLNKDVDEHEAKTLFNLYKNTGAYNVYIPSEMFETCSVYVQRVASKVRNDPDFIHSVMGYLVKMLGAQTLVGSVALTQKTYNVDQSALIDVAYAVIHFVQRQIFRIRRIEHPSSLWQRFHKTVCELITDTWVGDFLDWLYPDQTFVDYLPTELTTFQQGGNLGYKFKVDVPDVEVWVGAHPPPPPPRLKAKGYTGRVFRGCSKAYQAYAARVVARMGQADVFAKGAEAAEKKQAEAEGRPVAHLGVWSGDMLDDLKGFVPKKPKKCLVAAAQAFQVHEVLIDQEEMLEGADDDLYRSTGPVALAVAQLEDRQQQSSVLEEHQPEEVAAQGVTDVFPDVDLRIPVCPSFREGLGIPRRMYEWTASGLPSLWSDLDDPGYKPQQHFENLSKWEEQAKSFKTLNGWHMVPLSTYKGDDVMLDWLSHCVEQIVLVKHRTYVPAKFQLTFSRNDLQAEAAKIMNHFTEGFPNSEEGLNGLEKTLFRFGNYIRGNLPGADAGFAWKMNVESFFRLEGGPGCGKSYSARRIMQYMSLRAWVCNNKQVLRYAVLVPLKELVSEYKMISMRDVDGTEVPAYVMVKTIHKVTEFEQCEALFVDEFCLVDSISFAIALRRVQPRYVILMGDTLQGHVRPEHGTPIFTRWPQLQAANTYRMVMNYRNPSNHVRMLSSAYCEPHGMFMMPTREDVGKVYAAQEPDPKWQHPDFPTQGALPTYSSDDGKRIHWVTFTENDKDVVMVLNPGLKKKDINTVTSIQGKTFDHLGIVFTGSAHYLLDRVRSQPYVAFSRHRGNLYLVNPRGDMAVATQRIVQCLDPKGLNAMIVHDVIAQNVAGFPVIDAKDEVAEPEAPASAAVMPERASYDAYLQAQEVPDPHLASLSEAYAALPLDVKDDQKKEKKPKKPMQVEHPYNTFLGKGGRAQSDFKDIRQVTSETAAILSQTAGPHQTARTVYHRFGRINKPTYTPQNFKFCDDLVDTYFKDVKSEAKILALRRDNALFNQVVHNWVTDANERKYFARMFGMSDGVDDLLLGFHFSESDGPLLRLDKVAGHLAQKAQNKAVNQQKGLDLNKPGQPLVSLDLKVVIKYAILCRWLTVLDMLTSKTEGDWVAVEHNGRDVTGVKADIDAWLKANPGFRYQVVNCDIAESDIGFNRFGVRIVTRYNTKLAGDEFEPILVEMFEAFGAGLKLSSGKVTLIQGYENLSGSPWTLLNITQKQKVINHYIVPTTWHCNGALRVAQKRLESNIGDDAVVLQPDMDDPNFRREYKLRSLEVEVRLGFRYTIVFPNMDNAVEFVGHIVGIDAKGEFAFTPSLGRRLRRFCTRPWPMDDDAAKEQFGAVQQSIRDYFDSYECMKDEIIKANAQLIFNEMPEDLPDLNARQLAQNWSQAQWEAYQSFGHVKWEQFKIVLSPTQQWTNARVVVHEGGTAALI